MSQTPAKIGKPLASSPPINKVRPSTPKSNAEKPNSRSSTPVKTGNDDDTKQGKMESPLTKVQINDSPKLRSSPKPVILLEDNIKKNGHPDETTSANGTNGNHMDENGSDKKIENKPETPKSNKKDKAAKQDVTLNKKQEKDKKTKTPKHDEQKSGQTGDNIKITKSSEKKQPEILSEKTQLEMESLVIEAEAHADSPMPKSIGKSPGRILKLSQGPPARGARISPFKKASECLQNASTIVNLSTVSEQSVESTSTSSSPAISNDSPLLIPQGRISGRRTTRPIKEIKLIHTHLSNSNSSLNATVGSPIHNDSLRTPIVAQLIARKRKDGTPEYEDIHNDSPSKRLRIDFSGFLGYVRTPVTLLRNRLSRVGLQSSTPRVLDTEDQIADVSGIETEEIKSDVPQVVEAMESTDDKEIDDIKSGNIEKSADSDDSDIEITTPRRRSICNIM
jgi:hypothetical protein